MGLAPVTCCRLVAGTSRLVCAELKCSREEEEVQWLDSVMANIYNNETSKQSQRRKNEIERFNNQTADQPALFSVKWLVTKCIPSCYSGRVLFDPWKLWPLENNKDNIKYMVQQIPIRTVLRRSCVTQVMHVTQASEEKCLAWLIYCHGIHVNVSRELLSGRRSRVTLPWLST